MRLICVGASKRFNLGDIAVYDYSRRSVENLRNGALQSASNGYLGVEEINKVTVPQFAEYEDNTEYYKVECTKKSNSRNKRFLVGNIYIVVDGMLYDNDGKPCSHVAKDIKGCDYLHMEGLSFRILDEFRRKEVKDMVKVGDTIILNGSHYGLKEGMEFNVTSIEDDVITVKNENGFGCLSRDELKNFTIKEKERVWTDWKHTKLYSCFYRTNQKEVEVEFEGIYAKASCHDEDQFSLRKGILIAKKRAQIEKLKKEIRLLSK